MPKKKVKYKPLPYKSKRPQFRVIRIISMIVLGLAMIGAIIAIFIKYYRLVTQH